MRKSRRIRREIARTALLFARTGRGIRGRCAMASEREADADDEVLRVVADLVLGGGREVLREVVAAGDVQGELVAVEYSAKTKKLPPKPTEPRVPKPSPLGPFSRSALT